MNISTSAVFLKSGNFGWRDERVSSPKRNSFPLALGIRVNTRMTVTVVKHYLLSFHTALLGA